MELCNETFVAETAAHFHFLPNVMHQVPNDEYYCASYTGVVNDSVALSLRGCFYSTYNPCAFVSKSEHLDVEYKCKYCNLEDGCNSSIKLAVLPVGVYLIIFKFTKLIF